MSCLATTYSYMHGIQVAKDSEINCLHNTTVAIRIFVYIYEETVRFTFLCRKGLWMLSVQLDLFILPVDHVYEGNRVKTSLTQV